MGVGGSLLRSQDSAATSCTESVQSCLSYICRSTLISPFCPRLSPHLSYPSYHVTINNAWCRTDRTKLRDVSSFYPSITSSALGPNILIFCLKYRVFKKSIYLREHVKWSLFKSNVTFGRNLGPQCWHRLKLKGSIYKHILVGLNWV
jgi:hypothetical protein